MKARLPVLLVTIALVAGPLLVFPIGFSAGDGSGDEVVYAGLAAVEVVTPEAEFGRIGEVRLEKDGVPMDAHAPVPGRRSVGVRSAIFRLREPLGGPGGRIRVTAPFLVNARNLYEPVFRERVRILLHRLSVNKSIPVLLVMGLAPLIFAGGILFLSSMPDGEDDSGALREQGQG